jgi:hypothetical protein
MPEAPDLREYDASIPFYDRTPKLRALRATCVKFVDSVGTHLICPRRACKRVAGCADRDPRDLPFCWKQYRGMLRFLLCVVQKRRGITEPGLVPDDERDRMPEPFRGESLFASLAAAGADLDSLARPAEAGPDDFTWEAMPEFQELFRQMTAGASAPAAPLGGA